ncbi:MAG: hypothetical protein AAF598_05065 [Bacteroidota bacterium]
MKYPILGLFLFLFSLSDSNAQLEQPLPNKESFTELQTGLLGLWIGRDFAWSNAITTNLQVGYNLGFFRSSGLDANGFVLGPVIRFEPRFYNYMNQRVKRGKPMHSNLGNFVGLRFSYTPSFGSISSNSNLRAASNFQTGLVYVFRRAIHKSLNYELGLGPSYIRYFDQPVIVGGLSGLNEFGFEIRARIGFRL